MCIHARVKAQHTTMNPERGIVYSAALAAGWQAYNTGQNVADVLGMLGYAQSIIGYVIDQIYNTATQPDTQTEEENMRPTSAPKRMRRSTIPVAPSVKKYVKRCMNKVVEKKFVVKDIALVAGSATGVIQPAGTFDITQGDTDSSRDGNIIHITSFTARLITSCNVGAFIRFILVKDRQSNNGAPSVSGAGSGVLDNANFTSNYNANTVVGHGGSRFVVLYDKTLPLNPKTTTLGNLTYHQVNLGKKVAGPVVYSASGGTLADITSGSLNWIVITDSVSPSYAITNKIEFRDN